MDRDVEGFRGTDVGCEREDGGAGAKGLEVGRDGGGFGEGAAEDAGVAAEDYEGGNLRGADGAGTTGAKDNLAFKDVWSPDFGEDLFFFPESGGHDGFVMYCTAWHGI